MYTGWYAVRFWKWSSMCRVSLLHAAGAVRLCCSAGLALLFMHVQTALHAAPWQSHDCSLCMCIPLLLHCQTCVYACALAAGQQICAVLHMSMILYSVVIVLHVRVWVLSGC